MKNEGQVDTRAMRNGKVRLRFRLHPDQHENVRAALNAVKADLGTVHDEQALDALATLYLSVHAGAPPPAPRPSEIENTLPAVVDIADYPVPVEPEHPEDCTCSSCVVEIGPYVPPPEVLLTVEHAEAILDREFPAWRDALFPPPAKSVDGTTMISEPELRQWIMTYGPEPEDDDEQDAVRL